MAIAAGPEGKKLDVVVINIDLDKSALHVLSVPFAMDKRIGESSMSIRTLAPELAKTSRYKTSDWLLVNGGFSSAGVDVPLGLLVVDGKTYSRLSKEQRRTEATGLASPFSNYRWSGILCQDERTKEWSIVAATKYQAGQCHQALQGGPVLVEPGGLVGISPQEAATNRPYPRTLVCLTRKPRMKVIVAVDPAYLLPLARWSALAEDKGGLACDAVLNLSGDNSTGVAFHSTNGKLEFTAEGSFPIPTALLFEGHLAGRRP